MLDYVAAREDKSAAEKTLVEKAKALGPALKHRALKAEEDRRIPLQTHEDFINAGFYSALQPKRYGGLELDYGAQTAFASELGRACASSGWIASILACHAWIAGMFPDEAQSEIWIKNPNATIATSFLPVNTNFEFSGEDLVISGRWRFSSGVNYCSWAILLALLPQSAGEPPDPVFALINLKSCVIEDRWNSAGLTATGSNDIIVDAVHVPAHRTVRINHLRGEKTLDHLANQSYLYRLPLFAVFPFNIIGPALGAANSVLEDVVNDLSSRKSVTGSDLSRVGTAHQRIGRATSLLDSAEALISKIRMEIVKKGYAGEKFSMVERARYRLNLGYIAKNCCDAVDELLPLTGGRGLEKTHPMQRAWRDVHAIAQHIGLVWDLQTSLFGNILLGHGSPDPKL